MERKVKKNRNHEQSTAEYRKNSKMTGYDNFLTKALTFPARAVIIKLLKK